MYGVRRPSPFLDPRYGRNGRPLTRDEAAAIRREMFRLPPHGPDSDRGPEDSWDSASGALNDEYNGPQGGRDSHAQDFGGHLPRGPGFGGHLPPGTHMARRRWQRGRMWLGRWTEGHWVEARNISPVRQPGIFGRSARSSIDGSACDSRDGSPGPMGGRRGGPRGMGADMGPGMGGPGGRFGGHGGMAPGMGGRAGGGFGGMARDERARGRRRGEDPSDRFAGGGDFGDGYEEDIGDRRPRRGRQGRRDPRQGGHRRYGGGRAFPESREERW